MEFLYSCDESGITITKWIGDAKKAIIPRKIEGKPVIKIADYAFSDNLAIKKVVINANLEVIGDFSFQFCEKLENINLPQTVRYIGESAFEGCISLKEVNIPPIKHINKSAFEMALIAL